MIFVALSAGLQLAFGWLLADFLSGVLHWSEDRGGPGREHWPILGSQVFAPNIQHHSDPLALTESGFVERNWTTWAAVAPIALVLAWIFGLQLWIVSAATGGAMANEIHTWAHRKTMAPAWAQSLQQIGLIQSPKQHAVHHVPDFKRNYCIVTDYLNPTLERLDFWRRLESLVPRSWFR